MKEEGDRFDWPLDERPLAEMAFAIDAPETERATRDATLRKVFADCGVKVANDIALLGCTGLYGSMIEKLGMQEGTALEQGMFVRKNMAGSGVGLPCYVPPDRYCLVHDTIGGLQVQKRQKAQHEVWVDRITRPLSDAERGHIALVEHARHVDGPTKQSRSVQAAGMLTGRHLPKEIAVEDPSSDDLLIPPQPDPTPEDHAVARERQRIQGTPSWTCDEHTAVNWACRFCVAAEIVGGPLDLSFHLIGFDEHDERTHIKNPSDDPQGIEHVKSLPDDRVFRAAYPRIEVYVRAAVWERRLVRRD